LDKRIGSDGSGGNNGSTRLVEAASCLQTDLRLAIAGHSACQL